MAEGFVVRGGGGIRTFRPRTLFAEGQQGAWLEASDISTLFQTEDTSTPVTAAGQPIGRWEDKSGLNNHAVNANAAQRPLYQVDPDRLELDKVDDKLVMDVPPGGFTGTMVLATPEGTAAYGVSITSSTYDLGGEYFPGSAMQAYLIRDTDMTEAEIERTIIYFRQRGGGGNYAGVTSFRDFWRERSELTRFPEIDTSNGTNFRDAWRGCSSLTQFPLLDVSNGTTFLNAWSGCSSLTQFPLLDVSSGTTFSFAWFSCSSLTEFPLLDVSNGDRFDSAWRDCSSLTEFPLLDVSNGDRFDSAWRDCSSLTEFPLLDVSNGDRFDRAWQNCSSLTEFPLLDVSNGTRFDFAWRDCSSLVTFPANFFDGCAATNFDRAFDNTNLNEASIDGILVSIESNGTSNGDFLQSGGSPPSATGEAAIDALRARGWTVTVTGGY